MRYTDASMQMQNFLPLLNQKSWPVELAKAFVLLYGWTSSSG